MLTVPTQTPITTSLIDKRSEGANMLQCPTSPNSQLKSMDPSLDAASYLTGSCGSKDTATRVLQMEYESLQRQQYHLHVEHDRLRFSHQDLLDEHASLQEKHKRLKDNHSNLQHDYTRLLQTVQEMTGYHMLDVFYYASHIFEQREFLLRYLLEKVQLPSEFHTAWKKLTDNFLYQQTVLGGNVDIFPQTVETTVEAMTMETIDSAAVRPDCYDEKGVPLVLNGEGGSPLLD